MELRDLVLLSIVAISLPFSLRHTWIGVLMWTWFSIMNPHRLAYGFAYDAPFAAAVGGATLLSLLVTRDKLTFRWEPPVVVLVAFVAWMCLTTAFAYYPAGSFDQLIKVLKIQLMVLVALVALRERKHIELFLWVNALSIGFYGVKGGIFTITTGGVARVWGPGGFIGGNNEIGLAIVMVIPLLNYLRLVATRRWLRLGLLTAMMLCATAALGTQSRGAFLALSAMGVVLWFRSKNKIIPAIGLIIFSVALLAFMPASWENRMWTIESYQEDESAMGRITTWIAAFRIANSNFLGGGFDIYRPEIFAQFSPAPDLVRAAHSIYFQVLGEHGWVGLGLYLLVLILALTTASQIRKEAVKSLETQWLHQLAGMCQVSLVGFAVGGAFLSLAYFDLPYNILVVLVVGLRWMQAKRWEIEPQGAFGSSVQLSQARATAQKGAQP